MSQKIGQVSLRLNTVTLSGVEAWKALLGTGFDFLPASEQAMRQAGAQPDAVSDTETS